VEFRRVALRQRLIGFFGIAVLLLLVLVGDYGLLTLTACNLTMVPSHYRTPIASHTSRADRYHRCAAAMHRSARNRVLVFFEFGTWRHGYVGAYPHLSRVILLVSHFWYRSITMNQLVNL